MHVSKIAKHEASFVKYLKDSVGTEYRVVPKNLNGLEIKILEPLGVDDYYYEQELEKQQIVLHFTAGYLKGDLCSLVKQGSHVSVPYLVARDGSIYQIFDPKHCWAYHLGKGSVGGNTFMSKKSIAIEISNIGPLTKSGNNLKTAYGDTYCTLADTEHYTKLDKPWRGVEYYANMTPEQEVATKELVKYLCDRFSIPATFIPEEKRYRVFDNAEDARGFKGICTHANYRSSGKWDIGPAFAWGDLISHVKGESDESLKKTEVREEPEAAPVVEPLYFGPTDDEPEEKSNPASPFRGLIGKLFKF